jgi:hypothetical protein
MTQVQVDNHQIEIKLNLSLHGKLISRQDLQRNYYNKEQSAILVIL